MKFPYTRRYLDRHGKLRIEYRRNGKTIRLHGVPGTAEFQAAYAAAVAQLELRCNRAAHSVNVDNGGQRSGVAAPLED